VTVLFKKGEIGLAHFVDRMPLEHRVADKRIGFAGRVPATLAGRVACPERRTTGFTDLPGKSLVLEIFELVFFFEHVKTT